MKFDIIIGNPPYNNIVKNNSSRSSNLYDKFTINSKNISRYTLFVTPARWLTIKNMSNFRNKILNKGLKLIGLTNRFFNNAKIDGGICYFLIDNMYVNLPTIKKDNKNIITDFSNNKITITGDIIINNILNKFKSESGVMSRLYKNPQKIKSNDLILNSFGNIKILQSKNRVKFVNFIFENLEKIFAYSKYKICFERVCGSYKSKGFSNLRIEEPGCITTQSIAFFDFDDKISAESCLSYINSKIFTYIKLLKQSDKNYSSPLFENFPIIPFNKIYSDLDLYKYFNLSQEEIYLIETTTKSL